MCPLPPLLLAKKCSSWGEWCRVSSADRSVVIHMSSAWVRTEISPKYTLLWFTPPLAPPYIHLSVSFWELNNCSLISGKPGRIPWGMFCSTKGEKGKKQSLRTLLCNQKGVSEWILNPRYRLLVEHDVHPLSVSSTSKVHLWSWQTSKPSFKKVFWYQISFDVTWLWSVQKSNIQ